MVEMQAHAPQASLPSTKPSPAMAIPQVSAAPRPRQTLLLDTYVSPVNQNGSFEFDRVIKAGYVQRRTQKTKVRLQTTNFFIYTERAPFANVCRHGKLST